MAVYIQTNQIITPAVADATISAADTGKIFLLPNLAAAAHTLTLPALQAGLHYVFINTAMAGANNWVITSGAATVKGLLIRVGVAVASAAGAGGNITFVGGTSVVGDRAEYYCDGVQWSVMAFSNNAAGITAT